MMLDLTGSKFSRLFALKKVGMRHRQKFENFVADMGERPDGLSIGRRDNSKDYEPSNCKWETSKEQNTNRRPAKCVHCGKPAFIT